MGECWRIRRYRVEGEYGAGGGEWENYNSIINKLYLRIKIKIKNEFQKYRK